MTGLYKEYKEFQESNGPTNYFWLLATKNMTYSDSGLPEITIGDRYYVFYCESTKAHVLTTWSVTGEYSQAFNEEELKVALGMLEETFVKEFETKADITLNGLSVECCEEISKTFGISGERVGEESYRVNLDAVARINPIMRRIMHMKYKGEHDAVARQAFIHDEMPSILSIEVVN